MRRPYNNNLGKSPFDPDYDDTFDYEEEMSRYEREIEAEEDEKRMNQS